MRRNIKYNRDIEAKRTLTVFTQELPMRYLLEKPYEILTTRSGMALVGLKLLKTEVEKKLNEHRCPTGQLQTYRTLK